jgi:hypothetical protein
LFRDERINELLRESRELIALERPLTSAEQALLDANQAEIEYMLEQDAAAIEGE